MFGRVKGGELYLCDAQELFVVLEFFIHNVRANLSTHNLFGVRLVGLFFGCSCLEGRGLGGFRGAVYRGTVCSEPDCHVLRERSQWRRADLGHCWRTKGGLLGGVLCRLKLFENGLGKCVLAVVPGGFRARVECAVEYFGTSN